MKMFIFVICFFSFFINISARASSDIYISKRDINTMDIIEGSEFSLYDSNNNIVASWNSSAGVYHLTNIKEGTYNLIERPSVVTMSDNKLDKVYKLDIISNNVMEITLYDELINTPDNLKYNKNFFIGYIFILLGIYIIFIYNHFSFS